MLVKETEQLNFAFVMPNPPGAPIRIVIPAALQMGWTKSLLYFCTATKTARDIT
jgi:hypothetical protein